MDKQQARRDAGPPSAPGAPGVALPERRVAGVAGVAGVANTGQAGPAGMLASRRSPWSPRSSLGLQSWGPQERLVAFCHVNNARRTRLSGPAPVATYENGMCTATRARAQCSRPFQ